MSGPERHPTSTLESSYRSMLRWYPRAWRDDNADAMIGILLDQADGESRTRPTAAERLNLASNGLRARARLVSGFLPEHALERGAALSLGLGTAFSVAYLVLYEWSPWWHDPRPHSPQTFGPFLTPASLIYLLWIAAFIAFLLGLRRSFRVMLAGVLVALAVVPPVSACFGFFWMTRLESYSYGTRVSSEASVSLLPDGATFVFLGMLALVALAGNPRRRADRFTVVIAGIGSVPLFAFMRLSRLAIPVPIWQLGDGVFWADDLRLAIAIGLLGMTAIVLSACGLPSWAAALLFVTTPLAVGLALTVNRFQGIGSGEFFGRYLVADLGAVLTVAAGILLLALRMRRAR